MPRRDKNRSAMRQSSPGRNRMLKSKPKSSQWKSRTERPPSPTPDRDTDDADSITPCTSIDDDTEEDNFDEFGAFDRYSSEITTVVDMHTPVDKSNTLTIPSVSPI